MHFVKELEVEAEDGEAEALLGDGEEEGEKENEESKDEEDEALNLSGDAQNAKHEGGPEEKEEPTGTKLSLLDLKLVNGCSPKSSPGF